MMSTEAGRRTTSAPATEQWLPQRHVLALSAALVFLTAWGGIEFTRGTEHIATIWVANAVLLVALLKSPTSSWPILLLCGGLANSAANLAAGDGLEIAIGLPVCNFVEVAVTGLALRKWVGRHLDLSQLDHLGAFVLAGALVPALTGLLAASYLRLLHGSSLLAVWAAWYPADALGILVFVPLFLMLRIRSARALLVRHQRVETICWSAALLAVTLFTFAQSRYPFLFLPMAMLGIVAVRLGPAGTALGVGLVAIIATVATARGSGPMMLVPGDFAMRILVLQGFVAATVLSKLPLTALLSERARLEAEVRDSNKRLLLAEKIAQVGHWRLDFAAGTLTWSDEVYRIHGLDRATYTPTLDTAIGAYHPDDRAEVVRLFNAAMQEAGEYDFALRLVRSDSAVRDVLCRGLCETGPSGEVTAVFGTIMDVTDVRQAERSATESEERYRLLADHSGDLIALKPTFDSPRTYVSPSSRSVVGYEPEEFARLPAAEFVHPDDRDRVAAEFASLSEEHPELISVHRVRHKNGSWIWIEVLFTLINVGQRDQGVIVRARDISARYQAEQALALSEARYRLLANNVSDLIVLGHEDGRRSYISPTVTAMLGYTVEEAHRVHMRDWVHPDDVKPVFTATRGLSAERPTSDVTYRLRHKAGHYIWAEAAFQRVEENGEIQIVTTIRDVSERKRHAELLEKAKIAAEAGARIKAEFLANMSHELRTPLTGMLGVHDLLQSDDTLTNRQRRLIDLAQDSGRSLLTIVNDILDFSKIDAGQMTIEHVPFSLREIVDSCERLGRETIKRPDVRLAAAIDAGVPNLLLGDPTRVRQVLMNLVTNAIKFTTTGLIQVKAIWPRGRLRMEVTDTGVGIPADVIPHLFERFSQADGSTARRFGGTGLGLSICKRLVELMGGTLGVESQPDRGSTFWFELPVISAEGDGRQRPRETALASADMRMRRILLAEDNAVNQEIIRAVLRKNRHEVTVVENGEAAIHACEGSSFDVILMDVQMPGTDGIAATVRIRARERDMALRPTPIIALTANAMAEEAERCRRAGMDAHVAKPIDWPHLFATIEHLCAFRPEASNLVGRSPVIAERLALDEHALNDLAATLGPHLISDMLAAFAKETRRRLSLLERPDLSAQELGTHTHAMVSFAGQLGFEELATFCIMLENEALTGGGLDQVEHLRRVAQRALDAASRSTFAKAA